MRNTILLSFSLLALFFANQMASAREQTGVWTAQATVTDLPPAIPDLPSFFGPPLP